MISYQNVLDGRGFALTFVGMAIVFLALWVLTLSVSLIPKILQRLEKQFPGLLSDGETGYQPVRLEEDKVELGFIAAIAYVLHHRRISRS